MASYQLALSRGNPLYLGSNKRPDCRSPFQGQAGSLSLRPADDAETCFIEKADYANRESKSVNKREWTMDRRGFLGTAAVAAAGGLHALVGRSALADEPTVAKLPRWRGFNLLEKFIAPRSGRS